MFQKMTDTTKKHNIVKPINVFFRIPQINNYIGITCDYIFIKSNKNEKIVNNVHKYFSTIIFHDNLIFNFQQNI